MIRADTIDSPMTMTLTALAAQVGEPLEVVTGWIAARRWPDGSPMAAIGPAGQPERARILRWDFERYLRDMGNQ